MTVKSELRADEREKSQEDAYADNEDADGFSKRSAELAKDCRLYERLVRELETRKPDRRDFELLEIHEANCPTGRHTEAGVERALGLPAGALRKGSPEHGLPSAAEVVASLIAKHLVHPDRHG